MVAQWLTRPLAWEPPYAVGAAQEIAKKKKKKKKKKDKVYKGSFPTSPRLLTKNSYDTNNISNSKRSTHFQTKKEKNTWYSII